MPQHSRTRVTKTKTRQETFAGGGPPARLTRITSKHYEANFQYFQDHRECWVLEIFNVSRIPANLRKLIFNICRITENEGDIVVDLMSVFQLLGTMKYDDYKTIR